MSQIIPLGIGSPAGESQLVLTGLSPVALPPPPPEPSGGETLAVGITAYSYDLFSSVAPSTGLEFVLPAWPVEVTWQTIYATPPAVADIVIELSLDGINWSTKDTTTNVNGELRTFETSARFIRAAMLDDMTEGVVTTVEISIRKIDGGWY